MINWHAFEVQRENDAVGYWCEQCGCDPCELENYISPRDVAERIAWLERQAAERKRT